MSENYVLILNDQADQANKQKIYLYACELLNRFKEFILYIDQYIDYINTTDNI